jgi:mRNA-degrading endonuclease toxin of MazEF toxin-antitoxin module
MQNCPGFVLAQKALLQRLLGLATSFNESSSLMTILRGEVYFVKLGPTVGRELDTKRRPVVVLSINWFNDKPLVITVVPGTTHKAGRSIFKNEVKVEPSSQNGLKYVTLFQCLQIKALDHGRFDDDPVGYLSAEHLSEIEEATRLCLGIP